MANTLKFGNGEWYGKKDTILAYNDESSNYKPLPFNFSRASSATRVNKDGLIETVGSGQPRVDYLNDSNGALKLEPSRTNLVTYSEDFSQWSQNNVTLESGYLAPDGTNNAYKVSGDSTSSLTFSLGLSSTDTRTIWARTISGSGQVNLTSHNNNTNNLFTITEQWQRFEVNGTTSSSGQAFFYAVDFRGSSTLTEVVLWGAQAEAGSYATSYVPTQGSTVTRLADVCNNGANEQVINSTEGVLYAEISALSNDLSSRIISLSDGTNNNRIHMFYFSQSNDLAVNYRVGGSTVVSFVADLTDITNLSKVAFKWESGNFKMYVDGVLIDTDSNTTMLPSDTLNTLSFSQADGNFDFYGKCKDLRVYNTALSDSELQALTT